MHVFRKKSKVEKKAVVQLYQLQKHDYPIIAYAATMALINTSKQQIRDRALQTFLQNSSNASMAVNDVVYKYCGLHEDTDQAAHFLMEIVSDQETPVKTASAAIRMFPKLSFHQLTEPLFVMFCSPLSHDQLGQLRATLLNVLNKLSAGGLDREIIRQKLWQSPYQLVRLETARWIYAHPSLPLKEALVALCRDSDLEVRITAQKSLLLHANVDNPRRYIPEEFEQEWKEIKKFGDTNVPIL